MDIHHRIRRIFLLLSLVLSLPGLAGCDNFEFDNQPTSSPPPSEVPPVILPEAMITFRLHLAESIPGGSSIYLTILDEVTGLALNPISHLMAAEDDRTFSIVLPVAINSVIKYRYVRMGAGYAQEHLVDGRAVRYRLYQAAGPGVVDDTVARWTDTSYTGETGRISGQVTDSATGLPVPDILVTASGAQALSASDGSFLLEGLPPGTHNLVAYALDGAYRTFQHGAMVAAGSTTPAPLGLAAAPLVAVSFKVTVPRGTIPAVPLRLAGNLYQLGNTFGDLAGGVSTIASRMPVLSPQPDGSYAITLQLPAGADVRYKYTLGDGLWNAEHGQGGVFRLRQLIVPDTPLEVQDRILTWSEGSSAPITFDLTVPANAPLNEVVTIQFNPGFGWMQSVPMWPAGGTRWIYVLFSPLETLNQIQYRYCRNDQCGSADDVQTIGASPPGHTVSTGLLSQTLDDTVTAWHWLNLPTEPVTLPNIAIQPRGPEFMAGIEFQAGYRPIWEAYMPAALADVKDMGANWIVLTPSWTFTRMNQPVLEPVPGSDPLWHDLTEEIGSAAALGLNVAVFPTPRYQPSPEEWWAGGTRDFAWWVVWFDRYRNFLLNHADLAERTGAAGLVIGGPWLAPALPNGTLSDGTPSNVPADAEARWRQLIEDIRGRYSGTLMWALPYPGGMITPLPFLDAVDQVYLLWTPALAEAAGDNEIIMANRAGELLDQEIYPFQLATGKPLVLGIAFPSARGAAMGCLADTAGGCLDVEALARPNPDIASITLDLQEQITVYNAMLITLNSRDWISGFVSRGYYPPVTLLDKSTSIHGKPARGVLWYWFPQVLANP